MAVSRKCKNWGQKISIRQMPNGYWIPFDYNSEVQHKCKRKVKDNMKIADNNKLTNDTLPQLSKEIVLALISDAIENKKVLKIACYLLSDNNRWTIRRIVPHKLYEKNNVLYVDCYSYFGNEYRDYNVDRIRYVEVVTDKAYVPPHPDSSKINNPDFEKPQTQFENERDKIKDSNDSFIWYLIPIFIIGIIIYLSTK